MTERDDDAPKSAFEAEGSPIERLKSPVDNTGAPQERGRTASARHATGGSMGVEPEQAAPGLTRPRRRIGRRPATETEEARHVAAMTRPSDEDSSRRVATGDTFVDEHDPGAERRAELLVVALFVLSVIGTIGFCVAFFLVKQRTERYGLELNMVLGAGMALSMLGIGAAMIVWAKGLMPHEPIVQERGRHYSDEEEQLLAEEGFLKGVEETGFARRKMLRRTMLGALALFPLPFVVALRDLGPLPRKRLRQTGWKKDVRLVVIETRQPLKLGDLPIGGIATVMPEGYSSPEKEALSPTILIRMTPGDLKPPKGKENWVVNGHVAYNKICTHAGCPVALYEAQTHHLLCPCHQSTFDAARGAKVIFGPAARPLPMLPIYVDSEGYFRAQSGLHEPAGPSFWERG